MWPYWLLLTLPALASLVEAVRWRPRFYLLKSKSFFLDSPCAKVFGLFLVLMIGWRDQVGGDWANYLNIIELASNQTWIQSALATNEPAYGLLNWLGGLVGGIYFVNLVCALVFTWGLLVFAGNSPHPWLAITVAVPYLVVVVAMGYTRQGAAIGFVMAGLVLLDKGRPLGFGLLLFVAALFHKSAVVLFPLAIFSGGKSFRGLVGVGLTAIISFSLLLADYVEHFVVNYIGDQYASSGAEIRIAMNAIPGVIFIILRNRFELLPAQRSFWAWMSYGSLVFIGLLEVSPSSTAVDRLALYFIPLQIFVWSRLPGAISSSTGARLEWVAIVLFYSYAVQFVWLTYADHRAYWLPYRFYPVEWLFSLFSAH